jgi:type IV secretion system protein VirD4
VDNCHVRVAFAANDERTAKRLSDALGIATELRAMKNYAGHRLSPWLGHLMVSRQETARPLLTAGEVMQLPPSDELVLVSSTPPIRAKKARYFEDRRLATRVLPPPTPASLHDDAAISGPAPPTDWTTLHPPHDARSMGSFAKQDDTANSGIRREPELPEHEAITREAPVPLPEFALLDDERDRKTVRTASLQRSFAAAARQAAMDPDGGMAL